MTILLFFFFFNDTATTEIYTLSLHDALPISVFNGPVQVKHIENMQDWIKKGYFVYGGRKNEPEAKFYSGEGAMMTTSSAAYGTIKQNAKFKFAESTLPYYADVAGGRQKTIIGRRGAGGVGGERKEREKGQGAVLA